jgi:hypothetical protein
MSYKDGFDQLLADLGKHIGMDGLAFDENQFCHITVDDSFPVSMKRDDAKNQLVILGQISEKLPEQIPDATLKDLLALGLGPLRDHGIGVGYESRTENLILHQSLPLNELNLERIQVVLGAFFEAIKEWRQRLAEAATAGPGVNEKKDDIKPYGFV